MLFLTFSDDKIFFFNLFLLVLINLLHLVLELLLSPLLGLLLLLVEQPEPLLVLLLLGLLLQAPVALLHLRDRGLRHGQEQRARSRRTLDLRLVNEDFLLELQLGDLALDVKADVDRVQVHVHQRGVHEAGNLDLEQDAGAVLALLE